MSAKLMSDGRMRVRRRYALSLKGRESLRLNAATVRPWLASTGPRSQEGKARTRLNGLKHGERSVLLRAERHLRDYLRSPAA